MTDSEVCDILLLVYFLKLSDKSEFNAHLKNENSQKRSHKMVMKGRMTNTHHIDPDARIQSIHLRNPRNFRCRQANSHRKQSVLSVGQYDEC